MKYYIDVNENIIKEGDIVRFRFKGDMEHYLAEVQWNGLQWKFGNFSIKDMDMKTIVIIGNIYDNWS